MPARSHASQESGQPGVRPARSQASKESGQAAVRLAIARLVQLFAAFKHDLILGPPTTLLQVHRAIQTHLLLKEPHKAPPSWVLSRGWAVLTGRSKKSKAFPITYKSSHRLPNMSKHDE